MKSMGYASQGCDPFFFLVLIPIFSHTFSHTVCFAGIQAGEIPTRGKACIQILSFHIASLVSQRWEEVLLNRVLADFRPILQFAQQG